MTFPKEKESQEPLTQQLRNLHCAAYVILHSFQADMLVGTELECSTITTMREKLLLNAVNFSILKQQFFQQLPQTHL